ncbi:MAG: class I SAM-dependent methyltransferase [Anaerolineaceae bacterium]|nr:class I SAM-dependent methyltransferase [Anaerolineaceae bacterium]
MNQQRMNSSAAYTTKAEKYARYRWDYASQAIEMTLQTANVTPETVVVDIGAGTGILTRHFVDRAGRVWAVEPNAEMRRLAEEALAGHPTCRMIDGLAEATTLPDACADLVTAAQAVNWFDPPVARAEIQRILKPGGWLAILRNFGADQEVNAAMEKIYPPETDTAEIMKGRGTPIDFYFEGGNYSRQRFEFTEKADWERFFGAACTASYAPDEGGPLFEQFERDAQRVFEQHQREGVVLTHGVTELWLGKVGR